MRIEASICWIRLCIEYIILRCTLFSSQGARNMELKEVLIRHKTEGKLLASSDDDQLVLQDEGKRAPVSRKMLWEFTRNRLLVNQLHRLILQVEPNSQNIVLGESSIQPGSNWIPTSSGKIHLASDNEMCLCAPKLLHGKVQVRFYDESSEWAKESFHWEIQSKEGKPVSIPWEEVDHPKFEHGYPIPGPQSPTSAIAMKDVFFVHDHHWHELSKSGEFDFVVVGSSFCGFAFVQTILRSNPFAKILILERGDYFFPHHFQNLPLPFKNTLGGVSETFPWSITPKTHNGEYIKWQHGQVPYLGGRSIMWSAWCPEPLDEDMPGWPKEVIHNIHHHFEDAAKLLNVVSADDIFKKKDRCPIATNKPIYGVLQTEIEKSLEDNQAKLETVTRIIPAPLAVNAPHLR